MTYLCCKSFNQCIERDEQYLNHNGQDVYYAIAWSQHADQACQAPCSLPFDVLVGKVQFKAAGAVHYVKAVATNASNYQPMPFTRLQSHVLSPSLWASLPMSKTLNFLCEWKKTLWLFGVIHRPMLLWYEVVYYTYWGLPFYATMVWSAVLSILGGIFCIWLTWTSIYFHRIILTL